MADTQRTTVYLKTKLFRALKLKSALTDRALSELVNEALALSLAEDAMDAEAIRKRAKEPSRPFAAVLRDLKKDGIIR
ncbi:MAG: CopG family transcriptional regulator [Acidobacteria bacterium]|nr:CopG family transcriptional regulator [Acidobacteriota bacterium]MCL5288360.1 CopG family transcriptional regulator [Acidobacteriota bacterium]